MAFTSKIADFCWSSQQCDFFGTVLSSWLPKSACVAITCDHVACKIWSLQVSLWLCPQNLRNENAKQLKNLILPSSPLDLRNLNCGSYVVFHLKGPRTSGARPISLPPWSNWAPAQLPGWRAPRSTAKPHCVHCVQGPGQEKIRRKSSHFGTLGVKTLVFFWMFRHSSSSNPLKHELNNIRFAPSAIQRMRAQSLRPMHLPSAWKYGENLHHWPAGFERSYLLLLLPAIWVSEVGSLQTLGFLTRAAAPFCLLACKAKLVPTWRLWRMCGKCVDSSWAMETWFPV